MLVSREEIGGIPALIYGEKADRVWLCVHGKMSSKESAEGIARLAADKGYQTISFDLLSPFVGCAVGPDKCRAGI